MMTVSQWCKSRSRTADVRILSLLKMLGQSLKALLVVSRIAPRS